MENQSTPSNRPQHMRVVPIRSPFIRRVRLLSVQLITLPIEVYVAVAGLVVIGTALTVGHHYGLHFWE